VYGRASNPSVTEFDIAVDTKGNAAPEFFVVGVDFGAVTAGAFDGRFASVIFAADGTIVGAWVATAPMNGSTLLLPALASQLNLTTGSDKLRYWVNSFSIVPGGLVDTTDVGDFRAYSPPASSGDFAVLSPGGATTMPLTVDKSRFSSTPVLGWLIVSQDDASGPAQTEQIPVGVLP